MKAKRTSALVAAVLSIVLLSLLAGCGEDNSPVSAGGGAEDDAGSEQLPDDVGEGGLPIPAEPNVDDNCDRAFNDQLLLPDPTSVNDLVEQATWIGIATVQEVTETSTEPTDDSQPTTTTLVRFAPEETWLGEEAVLDQPLVGRIDYFSPDGELAQSWGDHRLAVLDDADTVLLFVRDDPSGVIWLDPSPAVVTGETIEFGPCAIDIAEGVGAEEILALDGRPVGEVRSQIVAAEG